LGQVHQGELQSDKRTLLLLTISILLQQRVPGQQQGTAGAGSAVIAPGQSASTMCLHAPMPHLQVSLLLLLLAWVSYPS
jgi:hypothetical protein